MSAGKSTSGAAQRQRILEALRVGPKTSFDLRKLGVYQHSVRIFELREAGFDIETARVTIVDHDSYEHRGCALYTLAGEPAEGGRNDRLGNHRPRNRRRAAQDVGAPAPVGDDFAEERGNSTRRARWGSEEAQQPS